MRREAEHPRTYIGGLRDGEADTRGRAPLVNLLLILLHVFYERTRWGERIAFAVTFRAAVGVHVFGTSGYFNRLIKKVCGRGVNVACMFNPKMDAVGVVGVVLWRDDGMSFWLGWRTERLLAEGKGCRADRVTKERDQAGES